MTQSQFEKMFDKRIEGLKFPSKIIVGEVSFEGFCEPEQLTNLMTKFLEQKTIKDYLSDFKIKQTKLNSMFG